MLKLDCFILIALLVLLELNQVSGKNSKIRTSKAKPKQNSGGKGSKSETIKVDSDRLLGDNETDDLAYNFPDEQLLIQELLSNYDVAARPVFNASHPVVVKFNFALIQIIDMDERNQILTTNVSYLD